MVKRIRVERREAIRSKRQLAIQYRIVKSRSKKFNSGWHLSITDNMSISGIAFLSEIALRVGDMIELHVAMSGLLDIFNGYAKIVRMEKKKRGPFYLIAVKFLENKKLISHPEPASSLVAKN